MSLKYEFVRNLLSLALRSIRADKIISIGAIDLVEGREYHKTYNELSEYSNTEFYNSEIYKKLEGWSYGLVAVNDACSDTAGIDRILTDLPVLRDFHRDFSILIDFDRSSGIKEILDNHRASGNKYIKISVQIIRAIERGGGGLAWEAQDKMHPPIYFIGHDIYKIKDLAKVFIKNSPYMIESTNIGIY